VHYLQGIPPAYLSRAAISSFVGCSTVDNGCVLSIYHQFRPGKPRVVTSSRSYALTHVHESTRGDSDLNRSSAIYKFYLMARRMSTVYLASVRRFSAVTTEAMQIPQFAKCLLYLLPLCVPEAPPLSGHHTL
jgi:hypothetical protein